MEDVFVLEFASLILSELTKDPNGCQQLLKLYILGVIFNRMKNCPDPDVQFNTLQVTFVNRCKKIWIPQKFQSYNQNQYFYRGSGAFILGIKKKKDGSIENKI